MFSTSIMNLYLEAVYETSGNMWSIRKYVKHVEKCETSGIMWNIWKYMKHLEIYETCGSMWNMRKYVKYAETCSDAEVCGRMWSLRKYAKDAEIFEACRGMWSMWKYVMYAKLCEVCWSNCWERSSHEFFTLSFIIRDCNQSTCLIVVGCIFASIISCSDTHQM